MSNTLNNSLDSDRDDGHYYRIQSDDDDEKEDTSKKYHDIGLITNPHTKYENKYVNIIDDKEEGEIKSNIHISPKNIIGLDLLA